MNPRSKSRNELNRVVLCNKGKVTIEKYRKWEKGNNKKEIASFIFNRFSERYIEPLDSIPENKKNGFCIIANCCLMIEALESFHNGWSDTEGRSSQLAFCNFFDRVRLFSDFHGHSYKFYKNVRCGILHQAETTGGWKIRRDGNLFDYDKLIINATKFFCLLQDYLEQYRKDLESSNLKSEVWKNLRKKMEAIIKNCERN
jgi:hypothetical protein